MFETQIKEEPFVTRARPDSQRNTDSRNNLQTIFEVVSPPDARAKEECVAPLRPVLGYDHLRLGKHAFQNHIEPRVNEPDKTLPHVVSGNRGTIAHKVQRTRKESRASVPVTDQFRVEYDAQRQIRLQANTSRASSLE